MAKVLIPTVCPLCEHYNSLFETGSIGNVNTSYAFNDIADKTMDALDGLCLCAECAKIYRIELRLDEGRVTRDWSSMKQEPT